jgi:hypothetical protein
MKYKQAEHQTKYDYTLWYGHINQFQPDLRKFYSVQSLFRHRVVATRRECNCVRNKTGELISLEELSFGSRKAAARYVRKHFREINEDHRRRNHGEDCTHVAALRHLCHNKQPLYMNISRLEN